MSQKKNKNNKQNAIPQKPEVQQDKKGKKNG